MFRFLLLLWTFTAICSSCFINNCPPGGKRSGANSHGAIRQCTSCGQSGQCYGSRICCSKEFGCLFGTLETARCSIENQLMEPCINSGASCAGNDPAQPINGHCAAEGICCSAQTCMMDPVCHVTSSAASAIKDSATEEDEDCSDDELVLQKLGLKPKSKDHWRLFPNNKLNSLFPSRSSIEWSKLLNNNNNNKRFYFRNLDSSSSAGNPSNNLN